MTFQVSPGINVSEIDLTTIVPSVSTTEGAIAGVFAWGPTDERVLIGNELDLIRNFGGPKTAHNIETFFTAADFLAYSNALHVVRVGDGNTAVAAVTGANTTSQDSLDELTGKFEGAYGNSLSVYMVNAATYDGSTYEGIFNAAPTSNNHVNIAVVDTLGVFSAEANTVLEKFENVGLTPGDTTIGGRNNYIVDVLEQSSYYIQMTDDAAADFITFFTEEGIEAVATFSGGTDGSNEGTIDQGVLRLGYDLFKPANEVDVSLVLTGVPRGTTHDAELANYIIQNICEVRKDCIAFVSPAYSDVVNNAASAAADVVDFADNLTASSYGVLDSGYKYRYDKYNDRYAWTPLNGDVAGLCARTDFNRDPWFSPAGFNRGIIKNAIKLAFNPNQAERDLLYKNRVNPVITQAGEGILLFGDKTLASSPSAFDRINVRRLFITLEKAISRAARFALFEFNDDFTRASFVNIVEPFLRDVEGRRGIFDFKVVCDETNNTPEVIDRNEFIGDIYVKPARSINFIQLNFVAVRSDVEFDEVVGRF